MLGWEKRLSNFSLDHSDQLRILTNADTAPAAPTPTARPAALRTLQRARIQPECETAQRFTAAPARLSQLHTMLCFNTLERLIRSLSQAEIQPSKEPSVLHTQCQLPVSADRPVPKSPMGCCQHKCQAPKSQAAAPSQKRKATNSQKIPMSSWLHWYLKGNAGKVFTVLCQDRAMSPFTTWTCCSQKPGGFQPSGPISVRMTAPLSSSHYCHYLLLGRADSRISASSSSRGTDR